MSKAYIFINEHVQPYSYLKSNLNLGKKSSVKFDVLNSHVVNTVVLPGEIIIVGDDSVSICTAEEAFYMRKALEVHLAIMTNGMQSDGFLVENHELLTRILGYSSIGIGAVGGAWSKPWMASRKPSKILKPLMVKFPEMVALAVEMLFMQSVRRYLRSLMVN
jgi:hypothetical protein